MVRGLLGGRIGEVNQQDHHAYADQAPGQVRLRRAECVSPGLGRSGEDLAERFGVEQPPAPFGGPNESPERRARLDRMISSSSRGSAMTMQSGRADG